MIAPTMHLTKDTIYHILSHRTKEWDFKTLSSLPHPYTLKSCEQACAFLAQCIAKRQKILIVGDYDVDGVIASVVMMKFFKMIHYDRVEYVIPNRFNDGYGITPEIIKRHKSDVIITVDNGITAYEAAEYCLAHRIPLIITDHHLPKEQLPQAQFIINPQQPGCTFAQKEICGAMVAWYVCAGLRIALGKNNNLAPLLELVMLATIADMMPLTQINKCIVLYGLKSFQHSPFPPINKLKTQLKTRYPTATDISFSLTPLLNAAGRMGEGRIASEFLLLDSKQCDDIEQELEQGLQALLSLNLERKNTAKDVLESAHNAALIYDKAVIARGDAWHEGVLGIVAAQMAQHYKRPAFVLANNKHELKGSARSWDNADLMHILNGAQEILGEFGGHSKAAGLSMDNTAFHKFCIYLQNLSHLPTCEDTIDSAKLGRIQACDIDEDLFLLLQKFEPYGQANPRPILEALLTIHSVRKIKQIHQKFSFFETTLEGLCFFCDKNLAKGDRVYVNFVLQMDSFSNKPIMILQSLMKLESTIEYAI